MPVVVFWSQGFFFAGCRLVVVLRFVHVDDCLLCVLGAIVCCVLFVVGPWLSALVAVGRCLLVGVVSWVLVVVFLCLVDGCCWLFVVGCVAFLVGCCSWLWLGVVRWLMFGVWCLLFSDSRCCLVGVRCFCLVVGWWVLLGGCMLLVGG